jgi:hypothetical protein
MKKLSAEIVLSAEEVRRIIRRTGQTRESSLRVPEGVGTLLKVKILFQRHRSIMKTFVVSLIGGIQIRGGAIKNQRAVANADVHRRNGDVDRRGEARRSQQPGKTPSRSSQGSYLRRGRRTDATSPSRQRSSETHISYFLAQKYVFIYK